MLSLICFLFPRLFKYFFFLIFIFLSFLKMPDVNMHLMMQLRFVIVFCGISTLVGYLMPNSLYTNIKCGLWTNFVDNIFKQVRAHFLGTQLNGFKIMMQKKFNFCKAVNIIQCKLNSNLKSNCNMDLNTFIASNT